MTCSCGCPGAILLLRFVCWNPACQNYHEADIVRLSDWAADADGTNPRINGEPIVNVREFLKGVGQRIPAFLEE